MTMQMVDLANNLADRTCTRCGCWIAPGTSHGYPCTVNAQGVGFVPTPFWSVQRCPVCEGRGVVRSALPVTTLDTCDFCAGKKAVLVSAWGTVSKVV